MSPKWIQFAWASGALATTFLTDYAQPADEDMIWSIWKGECEGAKIEKPPKSPSGGLPNGRLYNKIKTKYQE
jgi:hypothetical protein